MSYVSLLLAVGDRAPADLAPLLDSLRTQRHEQWELHALLSGATPAATVSALTGLAGREPRVRAHVGAPAEVTAALQEGLDAAHGDVVAVLDVDEILHEDALAALAYTAYLWPEADVVYGDEDWCVGDGTVQAFHKPDWSPHYLAGCPYLGRPTAYRISLARAVGGFRDGTAPAHEWDLALRVAPHARAIKHHRQVLSHGRRPPWWLDPSADGRVAADRVAREAADPRAEVEAAAGGPAWFRVRRPFEVWPRVGVVIPTAGAAGADGVLVDRALSGLLDRTDHGDLDVCVVVSGNAPPTVEASLRSSYGDRITVLRLDEPFNYAASINAGVRATSGGVVLTLNDDTEVLEPDWLRRMVEHVLRPDVGVVGAKLLYPDGTVQHAGVCSNMYGMPYHPSTGRPDGTGYLGDLVLDLDYLAVTGACQVVRRSVFWSVGGYDTALPLNYNDVDFCLKVRTLGLGVVQANGAVLRHHESATRPPSVSAEEEALYGSRWKEVVLPDPYERYRPGPEPAASLEPTP